MNRNSKKKLPVISSSKYIEKFFKETLFCILWGIIPQISFKIYDDLNELIRVYIPWKYQKIINSINPNLGGLFRGLCWGVGGGGKITPS